MSLESGIPAICVGCWNAATVGRFSTSFLAALPVECFARFRRTEEPNDKVDARKYTDPDFDETKRPPEAGLWANIMIVCGFAFHVALSLLGASKLARVVLEDATSLFFVNVAEQDSSLSFWSVSKAGVARPCGVGGDFPGLQG